MHLERRNATALVRAMLNTAVATAAISITPGHLRSQTKQLLDLVSLEWQVFISEAFTSGM